MGYGFSPVRFRYRALNQKYNDVFINGMQMNDMETGQFRFSQVGGLNNQTRSQESSLVFEDNMYSLSALAGSNNYDFRSGDMATGHKASLLACNRNYTLRGMYTYNSGFNQDGWAWSASVTYRWADYKTVYVDGTFYNALSYFLGIEKILVEVGDNVRKHPDTFAMVKARGHRIGNHTFNHIRGLDYWSDNYLANVEKADEYLHTDLFRPPHGFMRMVQYKVLRKRYQMVMWDVVTRDYSRLMDGPKVFGKLKKYVRNGSIITFHDSLRAWNGGKLEYALPRSIEWLLEQGYTFKVFP